jgi:hypothetical protein
MKALRVVLAILTMAVGLVSLAGLVGCGNGGAPKFPVVAGQMPAGQAWEGVYYNPVYGYLHMIEQGGSIVGRWKRTDGSHWGELNGTVEGNVLRFTWKEHSIGTIGPSGESRGTGVFAYKLPKDSDIAELDGQYALDDSDSVGQWHCVKQNNVKPDLNQINGDNPDAPVVPKGAWQ